MPRRWKRAQEIEEDNDAVKFYWRNVLPRMDPEDSEVGVYVQKEDQIVLDDHGVNGSVYRIYFRDGSDSGLLKEKTFSSYKKARKAAVEWMDDNLTAGLGYQGHPPSSEQNSGYVEGDDLYFGGPTVTEVSSDGRGRPLQVACGRCGRDFSTGGLNGQGLCADCADQV